MLKFMLSRYQERDLIQPIAMKIFIKKKKDRNKSGHGGGNVTEVKMPGQDQ